MTGDQYICANRFTMADISFSYSLLLATSLGMASEFPAKLVPYWEHLQQRDGFKRAIKAEETAERPF
jgi:glutathione S-transferase